MGGCAESPVFSPEQLQLQCSAGRHQLSAKQPEYVVQQWQFRVPAQAYRSTAAAAITATAGRSSSSIGSERQPVLERSGVCAATAALTATTPAASASAAQRIRHADAHANSGHARGPAGGQQ